MAGLPPKPIPEGLLPVAALDRSLLPDAFDIAERMQCPADFPAVSALTAAGATLGRKIGIRPKEKDDWIEVANLWDAGIGRPGWLKSPAMDATLKPLRRLKARAHAENERTRKHYENELEFYELQKSDAKKQGEGLLDLGRRKRQTLVRTLPTFRYVCPNMRLADRVRDTGPA
jgi:hypothetical protein